MSPNFGRIRDTGNSSASPAAMPALDVRWVDHRGAVAKKHFVRFGQCQFKLVPRADPTRADGLAGPADPPGLRRRLGDCLAIAQRESLDVLVFPELSLTLPQVEREAWLRDLQDVADADSMIVVAGSYYDDDRYSRLVVIGPGWMERGYKVRPSRFEVSPKAGEGMQPGKYLLVLRTAYGTLAILTCVDLISDDVQYTLRRLASEGELDALININHNPAGLEFLGEANAIARRHPVFVSITNVANAGVAPVCGRDSNDYDESHGYCYGNSAIFASLRNTRGDEPNSVTRVQGALPPYLLQTVTFRGQAIQERKPPYDAIVAALGAFPEQLLIYDLNMWMAREPLTTNAPDQGYPPLRRLKVVDLPRDR